MGASRAGREVGALAFLAILGAAGPGGAAPERGLDALEAAERRVLVAAALRWAAPDEAASRLLFEAALRGSTLREGLSADRARILGEEAVAFEAFRREGLRDLGYSRDCERRAARANEAEKDRWRRFTEEANRLAAALPSLPGLADDFPTGVRGEGDVRRALLSRFAPGRGAGRVGPPRPEGAEGADPPDERRALLRELGTIHAQTHGSLEPMAMLLVAEATTEDLGRADLEGMEPAADCKAGGCALRD
ncbi:MAG: hypothetical protein HY722_00210 [Planctomycetes bacterium]|nr:hypothetical protein [Planctomycetota bacterium]